MKRAAETSCTDSKTKVVDNTNDGESTGLEEEHFENDIEAEPEQFLSHS